MESLGDLAHAVRLHETRRLPEAEEALRRLLARGAEQRAPRSVPVLLRLAGVLIDRGDAERAYAIADEAAALEPGNPLALNLRGSALGLVGRAAESEAAFRKALAIDPAFAEAWFNLGRLLAREHRMQEAVAAFGRALGLAPDFHAARRALAGALRDQGEFSAALEELDRVIAATGADAGLLNERGILLNMLGRPADAVTVFDAAVASAPEFTAPRFNRSIALLLQGDFRRGWAEYEHRFATGIVRQVAFDRPRWQGEAIAGKRIVLWGEQGQGDVLQFVRYAPLAAARGAQVTVIVHRSLVRLLQSLAGVERVVAPGEPVGPHDLHAPLMSLPALFGTTPDDVPAAIPYVSPDEATRRRWAGRIGDDGRLRVGIVWAGDPGHLRPLGPSTDRRRSIAPALLAPILDVPGVRFVSLQFGPRRADLPALPGLLDPMGEVQDFADTAAIVEQLDLVISVDTAVVHLAGALGRPVWVMSRFEGCFRWMLDRDDSPWYPSLRLFRQTSPGDWPSVIARVADALASLSRAAA